MRELIGKRAPAQRLLVMLGPMDASVLAAIAKWPNVPDVYGWLRLTARGEWRIRGEPIGNAAIRAFIGRNYTADAQGRWFFQNGPQRVYVALELAPWVYRVEPDGGLRTFTGLRPSRLLGAALVDAEVLVVLTELGAGNIDDRDLEGFLPALADSAGRPWPEQAMGCVLAGGEGVFVSSPRCGLSGGLVPLRRLDAAELAAAFGFDASPQAPG